MIVFEAKHEAEVRECGFSSFRADVGGSSKKRGRVREGGKSWYVLSVHQSSYFA